MGMCPRVASYARARLLSLMGRGEMTEMETKMGNDCFRDQTGVAPQVLDLWEPIVIPREEIDEEIERLASLPQPANGRRRSLFVHPRNKKSQGLAPGIEVALDVLKPGERTI